MIAVPHTCAILAILVGAVASRPADVVAQMDVPVEVQVPILLKILSFDRSLQARPGTEVVIAVVFQGGSRESVRVKDKVMHAVATSNQTKVSGLGVRAIELDLDRDPVGQLVGRLGVTHLYVTPLQGADVRALATLSRAGQIVSMTGVPRYLGLGLSLGVGDRGGRPRILINLAASRAEGAEFSAELLKLAELVR